MGRRKFFVDKSGPTALFFWGGYAEDFWLQVLHCIGVASGAVEVAC